MSVDKRNDADWIDVLSVEQMKAELERRGQSMEGIALRARLCKTEEDAQPGWVTPRTPTGMEYDPFELPEEAPMRPVEREPIIATGETARVDHTRLRPPRLELPTRVNDNRSAARSSSAMDVYHMMHRWNLQLSGARGSDAETFLTRIEEECALITVMRRFLSAFLSFCRVSHCIGIGTNVVGGERGEILKQLGMQSSGTSIFNLHCGTK